MTMLWGIASLFQIIALPGLIILGFSRQLNTSDRLLLAFPLSCVFNYALILILSLFGSYTTGVLHTLFLIELIMLAALILFVQKPTLPNPGYSVQEVMSGSNIILDRRGFVLMAFVVMVLAKLLTDFVSQFGEVFDTASGLGPIADWNQWALFWSTGNIPLHTGFTPQGLSALYSMGYVFTGEMQIQFFSKMVPGLFMVFAGLSILRLSQLEIHRRTLFLLCLVIYMITLYRFYGSDRLYSGFDAMPLQYFVVAFAYAIMIAHNYQGGTNRGFTFFVLLGISFAAFTAVIHPAGLFLALISPVVVFIYLLFMVNLQLRYIILGLSIIVVIAIAGHWYLYQWLSAAAEIDVNLPISSDPWYTRIIDSIVRVASKLSWLWIILVYFSLRHHIARRVVIWFLLPYFLWWSLYGDYNLELLALAVPALSLVMTFGLRSVSEWLFKRRRLMHIANYSVGFVVLYLVIGFAYIGVSDRHGLTRDILHEKSVAKQMQIGDPVLNAILLEFLKQHPEPGDFVSSYEYFQYLPFEEISERYAGDGCSSMDEFKMFHTEKSFRYILVTESCDDDVIKEINKLVRQGEYIQRFSYQENHLYERLDYSDKPVVEQPGN